MIGYLVAYDNIDFNTGFGLNRIALQRSVTPARARILGGNIYDLDGMYTYPAEQTYTAEFADRNAEFIAKPLYQRLGTYGWLKAVTRQSITVANWAKLISIDASAVPNDWVDIAISQRNRYTLTFSCSPFWYDENDSVITFGGSTGFTFSNSGNARSIYWQLNITSAITNPFVITIARNTGATYGAGIYGQAQYDGSGTQSITYAASKATGITLTIDARNNTAKLSTGANAYSSITLPNTQPSFGYLSPVSNRITFNQAVTGNLMYRGAYV